MFPDESSTLLQIKKLVPLFLGGLGVVMMVGGIAINYFQTSQNTSTVGKTETRVASVAATQTIKIISVEASGAVEQPGVYEIPADSRVKDVLIAAKGLVAKADRNYISKNINLAQRVVDGQKVYFPFLNESNLSNLSILGNLSNLININAASSTELDSLPGVGPVTVAKIIAGRPYQTTSELVSKKVLTKPVYDKLKDKISIN